MSKFYYLISEKIKKKTQPKYMEKEMYQRYQRMLLEVLDTMNQLKKILK